MNAAVRATDRGAGRRGAGDVWGMAASSAGAAHRGAGVRRRPRPPRFVAGEAGVAEAVHRLDCEAVLAVNPPARRGRRRVDDSRPGWRRVGVSLVIVVTGGCFKDPGPDL